jgi:tripartite-type tricarboxylate transporter receptor subunit TctC
MERELGVPVQIVNKPGASTQVANAEVAAARPDGYTLLMFAIPTGLITYLDAERKSTYDRSSFQPVATAFADGLGIAVAKDSPIKDAKQLVEMAKAKPGEIKIGTAGLLGVNHLGMLAWERQAGVRFAYVHFNSGLEAITAALGGHLDAATGTLGNVQPQFKNGSIRVLGIFDRQPSDLVPGAPTLESQGFPVYTSASYILAAPKGTPMEIVNVLNAAVQKAVNNPEYKTKVNEIGMAPLYMETAQAATHWEQRENETKPLLEAAKAKQ